MTDKQIIIDDQKKTIHRLQDECTEKTNAIIALGEQLEAYKMEAEEGKEINAELKAENERLEAHLATLDAVIETGRVQYKALKQTLAEIKEIIEQGVKIHDDIIVSKQILQKISEVENG